ncbi:23S rRNA (adenine(2503)-C(2))-methyltransferase RlmN [Atopobium sp. oral taxon 810]|uniref:23S rRNA (adenine(2503)-C(2))-methyltransferase RlmN n=1 Tax=Atopobium sp. oral taxon 810 TaxID=712158 RepID=UPI00039701A8|nr:23S rRNA (adenine(2503)-C(2))-methyltransferase RlmN [Atopobium sp. oral taxon 810]ERI06324.1 23S rRNA methyltransferase [Atopobium sp. oral taxon 810 str. F0209]
MQDPITKTNIRSLSHSELQELLVDLGQPSFRVKQIEEWIWEKNAHDFDEMTNLPKSLREALKESCTLGGVSVVARQLSGDGSRKYLLRFPDGVSVECVGMPSRGRLTVCASTQAGCGMGCAFCATGAAGLTRSLSSSEIYEQVMHVRDDFGRRVTSVVMMGQGEPFANYDATLAALRKLNSPDGAGIGARHLTVSTCGIIPNIIRFSKEPEQFTLAVSLHSAVQSTRNMLMPGVKRYSLLRLYDAIGEYVDRTGRRPTYEYALIKGINDNDGELGALCDFCRDNLAHVNIIQLNAVKGSRFSPVSEARAQEFVRALNKVGVEATIRNSRGADIDAACGQLRQNYDK